VGQFTIAENEKWKLINLAKGLPAYVHALGKHACLNALTFDGRTEIEELDVDAAIDAVIESSHHT
jgi:hypothetical protein